MIFQRNGVKIESAISKSKKIFQSTCKINISGWRLYILYSLLKKKIVLLC